jgi:hypothetical protein
MNSSLLTEKVLSRSGYSYHFSARQRSWILAPTMSFLRALDSESIIAFGTGVLVGLLIPYGNWLAIVIVIVVGALHQRLMKIPDRKPDRDKTVLRGRESDQESVEDCLANSRFCSPTIASGSTQVESARPSAVSDPRAEDFRDSLDRIKTASEKINRWLPQADAAKQDEHHENRNGSPQRRLAAKQAG